MAASDPKGLAVLGILYEVSLDKKNNVKENSTILFYLNL